MNWRVIGGLAAVSVAVLVVAPRAAFTLLPVLAALACPLSMVAMIWGMRSGRQGTSCSPKEAVDQTRDERIRRLEAEISSIRLERQPATPNSEDVEIGLALS
jgi:hypothetical protein